MSKQLKAVREAAELAKREADAKRISEMKILSKKDRENKKEEIKAGALEIMREQEAREAEYKLLCWTNYHDLEDCSANDKLERLYDNHKLSIPFHDMKAEWVDKFTNYVKSLGYVTTLNIVPAPPHGGYNYPKHRPVEAYLTIE